MLLPTDRGGKHTSLNGKHVLIQVESILHPGKLKIDTVPKIISDNLEEIHFKKHHFFETWLSKATGKHERLPSSKFHQQSRREFFDLPTR